MRRDTLARWARVRLHKSQCTGSCLRTRGFASKQTGCKWCRHMPSPRPDPFLQGVRPMSREQTIRDERRERKTMMVWPVCWRLLLQLLLWSLYKEVTDIMFDFLLSNQFNVLRIENTRQIGLVLSSSVIMTLIDESIG